MLLLRLERRLLEALGLLADDFLAAGLLPADLLAERLLPEALGLLADDFLAAGLLLDGLLVERLLLEALGLLDVRLLEDFLAEGLLLLADDLPLEAPARPMDGLLADVLLPDNDLLADEDDLPLDALARPLDVLLLEVLLPLDDLRLLPLDALPRPPLPADAFFEDDELPDAIACSFGCCGRHWAWVGLSVNLGGATGRVVSARAVSV